MRSFILAILPLTGAATIAACPPNPVTPPIDAADAKAFEASPPSDATTADCQSACDALARVGCKVLPDCAATVCKVNADPRFRHIDLVCVTHALTPMDVMACNVGCEKP